MSATDELRRLLDEYGVKHEGEYGMVKWSDGEFTYHAANAWPRNDPMGVRLVLHVEYPTPEQVIAATLGDDEHDQLKAENEKLRDLAVGMARALGVDTDWCIRECGEEFGCTEGSGCFIANTLLELGIAEVVE